MAISKDCSGLMKIELERKLRLEQLTDGSGDGGRKKSKSGEDGSYGTAQVSHGDGRRKKARLKKMVATTQLRLALET